VDEILEHHLEQLARLVQAIDERQQAVTDQLSGLNNKLNQLDLASNIQAVVYKLRTHSSEIYAQHASTEQSSVDTLQEFKNVLKEGSNQVGALLDTVARVRVSLRDRLNEMVQPVAAWTEEADGRAQHLEDEWGQVKARIDARLDAMENAMARWEERVYAATLHPTEEAVTQARAQLEAFTEQVTETIVPEQVQDVAHDLMERLEKMLDDAVDALVSQTDHFIEVVQGHTEDGHDARELLRPALDGIRSAIEQVEREFERVRDLASSVGVSL
jgi:DNA repair exonuclease SbcCD ATPase subunit